MARTWGNPDWRNRTAQIRAMVAEGLCEREIAGHFGIFPSDVRVYLQRKPHGRFILTDATVETLQAAAIARGLKVNELAAQLVERIVCDGLIEAVLDDGERPDV